MKKMSLPLLGSLFILLFSLSDLQAEHHHELKLDLGEVAPEFMAIDQDGRRLSADWRRVPEDPQSRQAVHAGRAPAAGDSGRLHRRGG